MSYGIVHTLGRLPMPEGKKLPPAPMLRLLVFAQTGLIVTLLAVVGAYFAPRAGLEDPFLLAFAQGEGADLWELLRPQLLAGLLVGAPGAAVFLAGYYVVFRPWLDDATVVEEVLIRWGLLSLLAWLISLLTPGGGVTATGVWLSILVSGIAFAAGHAPSYSAAGCKLTPRFWTAMLVLNLWVSLYCGWLFWQHGLAAAIVAHMLVHAAWLPLDLRVARRATT
ncbi:CPBP family glutamic-type intramembrane protease [Paenibacillus alginolyticus]|uniref:CPBP family glutamic-type intramembrane protease n=1 Tax=Paenibacillus alginolyticus TaxID=59839 RepID=A0ABT4GJG3_9BACL|nr:CPBP family glutamic-type intramembrane protease [Paenibacillus alginolyticus]MCY9696349.1 CPBP family glutamic-type intramembrane protease [Paenibacillus alginolyticus]MEC0147783.1 CPBP family glutamic-type intramembrane protease [Paenibacillus alginolyticus]